MRKFSKDEIKRLETGSIYLAAVEEGMADPKGEETLLESAPEELRLAFGGKQKAKDVQGSSKEQILDAFTDKTTTKIDESEAGKAMKEAFTGKKETFEKPKSQDTPATSEQIQELKEAFGGKNPDLEEAIDPSELLVERVTIDEIMEGEGGFRFKGRAVKVDRKNKNNRRYGRSITEKALKEAQTLMSQGHRFTVMSGHPKPGDTDPSKVVGKVTFGEIGTDNWMPYKASLEDTSLGLDLQKLLRSQCIGDVSLRSKGRTATAKLDGEAIDEVVDLHFRGLDLVIEGSEEGAQADEIFNAAN